MGVWTTDHHIRIRIMDNIVGDVAIDAFESCKSDVPYSITKQDKLQQIINHYENDTPEY